MPVCAVSGSFWGITPIQYVKQFRVEKAAELLRSTRLKTGEVGLECGFSDASYFIKTFREIKHCTPPGVPYPLLLSKK